MKLIQFKLPPEATDTSSPLTHRRQLIEAYHSKIFKERVEQGSVLISVDGAGARFDEAGNTVGGVGVVLWAGGQPETIGYRVVDPLVTSASMEVAAILAGMDVLVSIADVIGPDRRCRILTDNTFAGDAVLGQIENISPEWWGLIEPRISLTFNNLVKMIPDFGIIHIDRELNTDADKVSKEYITDASKEAVKFSFFT